MGTIIKNGIAYGASNQPTAAAVPYSNSTSGLTATNVQSAIDEVSASIYTKTIRTPGSISVNANSQVIITLENVLDSGETFLGVVGWDGSSVNQTSLTAQVFSASANTLKLYVANLSSSAKTMNYYQATVLVKK